MSSSSTPLVSTSGTSTNSGNKDKEPFKVRAELFAPTRLAPSAYATFRTRALVVDVLAHECLLLVLLAAKTALRARVLRESAVSPQLLRVGILGGGHVGSAVALVLLTHGYPSDCIAISTRQPERVPKCHALQTPQALALYHAVPKYYDNARLGRESDVLVLCMPPSQLKSVAIQIKHALSVSDTAPTLVVSVLCGASHEQLQKASGMRAKLVVRAKVHVASLAAASSDDTDNTSDDTLRNDSSSSNGSVNGSSSDRSAIALAAHELGREPQDVEHLVQVFTELGHRTAAAVGGKDDDGATSSVLDDPVPYEAAARELLRLTDIDTNSSRGRAQIPTAACWRADWDDILAHVQHVVSAAAVSSSRAATMT